MFKIWFRSKCSLLFSQFLSVIFFLIFLCPYHLCFRKNRWEDEGEKLKIQNTICKRMCWLDALDFKYVGKNPTMLKNCKFFILSLSVRVQLSFWLIHGNQYGASHIGRRGRRWASVSCGREGGGQEVASDPNIGGVTRRTYFIIINPYQMRIF